MTSRDDRAVELGSRAGFPRLQTAAYLNHAAIAPASSSVVRAAGDAARDFAARGVGAFGRWQRELHSLRARLAAFIGAAGAEDIGFVPNTTSGVTAIALGFPWNHGDGLVLCRGEFPANVTPWQRAAELFGLRLHWLRPLGPRDDEHAWLAELEALLSGRRGTPPRLVALSAVQFQTGLRMPLSQVAARCRRYDTQLFVDAIQACGAVPLDVVDLGIDYLACGGHKWLMGLPGLGMLYIRPERVARLRPHTAGWTSHEDATSFLFSGPGRLRYDRPLRARADVVESGMTNLMGAAAWSAALTPLEQLGVPAIFAHIDGYLDVLERGLVARGFTSLRAADANARSGILSVQPPADIDVIALHGAMDATQVSCSTPDGRLRFAPHWPNAPAEVPAVLDAVDRAVRQLRDTAQASPRR